MSSLTVLETNLFSICKDLKTDKVAPRLKAFNKLDGILDGRLDELHVLFKDSTLNWTYLLSSAHEGLLQHAEKLRGTQIEHEHDPKILNYMKVVTKIVNSANESRNF